MNEIVLGIDVSKRTLDVALIFEGRTLCKQFKNSAYGFKSLAALACVFENQTGSRLFGSDRHLR